MFKFIVNPTPVTDTSQRRRTRKVTPERRRIAGLAAPPRFRARQWNGGSDGDQYQRMSLTRMHKFYFCDGEPEDRRFALLRQCPEYPAWS
jgi:hypothetical protein